MSSQSSIVCESVNAFRHLGLRPYCRCCGGRLKRGRQKQFAHVRWKSRWKTVKAQYGKARYKDHR